jgi:hypothetical protein
MKPVVESGNRRALVSLAKASPTHTLRLSIDPRFAREEFDDYFNDKRIL